MKHVCPDCSITIASLGWPCHALMDRVTRALFQGRMIIFDETIEANRRELMPALHYLENYGYLVSTEISECSIGIIPDLTYAYVDEWKAEVCWCYILNDEGDMGDEEVIDDEGDNHEFHEFGDI